MNAVSLNEIRRLSPCLEAIKTFTKIFPRDKKLWGIHLIPLTIANCQKFIDNFESDPQLGTLGPWESIVYWLVAEVMCVHEYILFPTGRFEYRALCEVPKDKQALILAEQLLIAFKKMYPNGDWEELS
jgi:hypothetical protein